MSENGVTSALDFRDYGVKVVELPTSKNKVRIRKLTPIDLLETGNLFVAAASSEDEEQAAQAVRSKIKDSGPQEIGGYYAAIIKVGVIEPMVVDCAYSDVDWDGGEIHISKFADDLFWLGEQIMEYSGLGGAAKAAPFPEEQETGDIGASHGQRVREAAKRVAEKQHG